MSGTILENLSNRKLLVVILIILFIQTVSFLIGAFFAPSPSNTEQVLATKCLANDESKLSILRTRVNGSIVTTNCRPIGSTTKANASIVFAFQLPLPREGIQLDYSRWMSNLIAIILPDITYATWAGPNVPVVGDDYMNGTLILKVRLAVRNIGDPEWKLYHRKDALKRRINCRIPKKNRIDGYKYDCDLIQLFELQSLYYDFYLVNLQFESDLDTANANHGLLTDLNMVAIHQNGGFTKVWLSMKTVFTVITLMTLVWFCKRLNQLHRDSRTLIEKNLIILGSAVTQLNIPLEYLTLWIDLPFMNFLSDVRQGILYCNLLVFWMLFVGEHLLDGIHRSRISSYYKQLSVVIIAFIALFVFDSCERGVQWYDPFFSIWEVQSHFAIIFIITASISSAAYFGFLSYHIWLVLRTISLKQATLPNLSSTRRLLYQGIIYRFKFLLLATLVCAAATIIAYILGQVSEEPLQWDDDVLETPLQWTSAMFTTVYAMWNCYIITLLILYAPSHKGMGQNIDGMSEEIEFNRLATSEEKNETAIDEDNEPRANNDTANDAPEATSEMRLLQDLTAKQAID